MKWQWLARQRDDDDDNDVEWEGDKDMNIKTSIYRDRDREIKRQWVSITATALATATTTTKKESINEKWKRLYILSSKKSLYKKRENSLFCVTELASLMSCRPQKRHQQSQWQHSRHQLPRLRQQWQKKTGEKKYTNIMRFLDDAVDDDSTHRVRHTHTLTGTVGSSSQFLCRFISLSHSFSLAIQSSAALMTANMWHYPLLFMSNQFKSPIVLFTSASFSTVEETTCVMFGAWAVAAAVACCYNVVIVAILTFVVGPHVGKTCFTKGFACLLAIVKRSSLTVFASNRVYRFFQYCRLLIH